MGLFDTFQNKAKDKLDKMNNPKDYVNEKRFKSQEGIYDDKILPDDELFKEEKKEQSKKDKRKKDRDDYDYYDDYDDFNSRDQYNLYPAQKPESFHFFILENQYQDLERAIRGVKDVWDKENQKWTIKRKEIHCFTDEESEEIVRTAQSHLSSDIKLAIFSREEYPILMEAIYEQLWVLFKEIMDYRYARYGNITKQLVMKQQAVNIFTILMMRIKANYSRAVDGRENRATHDSVKGQESLQQTDRREVGRDYT